MKRYVFLFLSTVALFFALIPVFESGSKENLDEIVTTYGIATDLTGSIRDLESFQHSDSGEESLSLQNQQVAGASRFQQNTGSGLEEAGFEILRTLRVSLARDLSQKENVRRSIEIARQSAPLMRQLITEDPEAAYREAIPSEVWRRLPEELQPLVARQFTEKGLLIAMTGCESGKRHMSLKTDSIGTSLVFTGQKVTVGDGNFQSRIQGVAFEDYAGLVGMDGTEPYVANENSTPQGAASYSYYPFIPHNVTTLGTVKVLYIIVKFSDETDFPTTVTNASNSLDQTAVLFDRYSHGKLAMEYDVVLVEIDSTTAADDTTVLRESVEEAFALGYNPDDYDSICRRNSNRGNFAWFGRKEVFLRRDNATTTLHEIGHNMDLQHANWWKVDAGEPTWSENGVNQLYAENFDAMSNSPRGDFNAYEKILLGWLSGNEFADDVSDGLYRIYPYDDYVATLDSTGVDGAHYAISVFKDATANNGGIRDREYVLSIRNQPEHNSANNPWFTEGIILHWKPWTGEGSSGSFQNGAFGTSYLDANVQSDTNGELGEWRPGRNTPEQYDGAVLIGQTYVDDDPDNRDGTIYITPLRKTDPDGTPRTGDEYVDVKIVRGDQTGNQAPTANWSLSATTIAPGESVAATVTATDVDDTELGHFWDFGLGKDGLARRAMPLNGNPSQTFTYDTEGTYTLSCVVSDGRGQTVTLSQAITVSNDSDDDGLSDSWENTYFGNLDQGPTDDPDNDGNDNLTEYTNGTNPAAPPGEIKLISDIITNVGSNWQTVVLPKTYSSMVVVANVVLNSTTDPVMVPRIRNATGNSFELRVQNPAGAVISGAVVHYMVVEEGKYTATQDGIKFEAVKFISTVTDRSSSWNGESRSYLNSYTNPVVLGQVMTENDANWSTFWCYDGASIGNPPSSSGLSVGKHVGADPNNSRGNETIGYVVLEAGSGTLGDVAYVSGLGLDIVEGASDAPPYTYSISLANAQVAIVTQAAMDGTDGGHACLFGADPLTDTSLDLVIDEDTLSDSERAHTTEQVGYVVFAANTNLPMDVDSDGIDDAWEVTYFGSTGSIDGSLDSDADGVTDFFEYLYGSIPTDAASGGFRLTVGPNHSRVGVIIDWEVSEGFVLGEDYLVIVSSDLSNWEPLPVEHYSLNQQTSDGMIHLELEVTHDYGTHLFIKFIKR